MPCDRSLTPGAEPKSFGLGDLGSATARLADELSKQYYLE
jgi:hypothetical protein